MDEFFVADCGAAGAQLRGDAFDLQGVPQHDGVGQQAEAPALHAGGADAQAFLQEIRRRYCMVGTIWLLIDRASAPTGHRTQALATALGICMLWLPKQAPELNAMDQLWRELKRLIAANRQEEYASLQGSSALSWRAFCQRLPPCVNSVRPVTRSQPALKE